MPTDTQSAAWAEQLTRAGVVGSHRSHSHHNNMGKLRRAIEGDPDCTFGLSGLEHFRFEEGLAIMAEVIGWNGAQNTEYVDPARTVAAAMEAGSFCSLLARPGVEVVIATGHPDSFLPYLDGVAALLQDAGAHVRRDLAGTSVRAGYRDRTITYEGPVACLADEWGPVHTHSPEGMRALLRVGRLPDLVVADHGWAGAAMEAGVPTVATLDTNDPALALGAVTRPRCVLIALDDGRPPGAYGPLLEAFTAGFRGGVGG